MEDKKRRSRTGCLTCRARRVKCDEKKPSCGRCETANIECAGYLEKKRLLFRRAKRSMITIPSSESTNVESQGDITPQHACPNSLPLVALPNNPAPSQRPHARARDILAYHQFLFRTMPTLFPPESLPFWRDYVCQEAWEVEYVYDAIVALGCMHRATLLLSQKSENDRDRGFDAKVIALQMYSNALKGVSENVATMQISMPLLLSVLILFAYVECFDGNVPATVRHIHMANHYFQAMLKNSQEADRFRAPIESCLQDLDLVRRVTLPHLKVIKMLSPLHRPSDSLGPLPSYSQAIPESPPRLLLQQLLDLASTDIGIKQLLWCPVGSHLRVQPEKKLLAFVEKFEEWKASNSILFHKLGLDEALSKPVNFSFVALNKLPLPPAAHASLPKDYCLVLALYCFYQGRLRWALSIYNPWNSNLELDAYYFLYQLLRFVTTALDNLAAPSQENPPLGCEALKIGLSPMLFLAGHFCPKPTWIRWILSELHRVGREGVFNSRAFASSLEVLSTLEKRVTRYSGETDIECFSSPAERIISVLFPDLNGQNYVTYYAHVRTDQADDKLDEKELYTPLCIARWSSFAKEDRPAVETCDDVEMPFYSEWVLKQPLVQEWVKWLTVSEFDLNQTLHDHLNGSRLLLDRNGMDR